MDKPIIRAINAAGSQSALSQFLGVHPAFVSQWATGRRPVPGRWCIPIEQATGGAVTRHDLRPDIFGEAPTKTEAA